MAESPAVRMAMRRFEDALRIKNLERQLAEARRDAFREAAKIAATERLSDETGTAEDLAYNLAIGHVIEALRREAEK